MALKTILYITLLLLGWNTFAHAQDWQFDAKQSRLEFEAQYDQQPIKGNFQKFNCAVQVTDDFLINKLDVYVEINTADMFNIDINNTIKTTPWFDVIHFPQAEFHSQAIKKIDDAHYVASGVLQIKNMKKPIELPFTWSVSKNTATLSGNTKINRNDFNIGDGQWKTDKTIGYDVKVTFAVNLHKKN
jgi:polyisoprenoid-binding protein YceI